MPSLWILNHYANTPDMPGESRHYELARRLIEKGYSVTIVASSFQHMLHQEMRLKPGDSMKIEQVDGVNFVWLKTFPYQRNNWRRTANMLGYFLRSYLRGRDLAKETPSIPTPQIVVGSMPHPLGVLSAYFLARHFRAQFVMEVRDLWPQSLVDVGRFPPWHPLVLSLRALEKFLYRKARVIITVLSSAAEYIRPLALPQAPIVWIPNGVDTHAYVRESYRRPEAATFEVRYVGSHGIADNLGLLLETANLLKQRGYDNVRFTFIGNGPERQRLESLRQKLALHTVEFRGPIPRQEVAKAMADGDALTLTPPPVSLYKYGLSAIKLPEYMAVGRPIVLACEPPLNPVEAAQCGLTVKPGDAEALADAILRLSNMSADERHAMGMRGQQYAHQHYDWTVLADRLHQCLESLTSKRK